GAGPVEPQSAVRHHEDAAGAYPGSVHLEGSVRPDLEVDQVEAPLGYQPSLPRARQRLDVVDGDRRRAGNRGASRERGDHDDGDDLNELAHSVPPGPTGTTGSIPEGPGLSCGPAVNSRG